MTSISVLVDHHLAPSFYFVAYYYHQGLPVANSLLINVQPGVCEGKVTGAGKVVCARARISHIAWVCVHVYACAHGELGIMLDCSFAVFPEAASLSES